VASLDEAGEQRGLERAAAAFSSQYVHLGVSFQQQDQYDGENRLARAELGGWYGRASVVASYAQSDLEGVSDGVMFAGDPSPGGAWIDGMRDDASAFAEFRLRRLTISRVWFDAIYRYQATGADYFNDLAPTRPGSVTNEAGLYSAHSRYALDGRLVYRDQQRFAWEDADIRTLEASARAFLRDNSQLLLRGGIERRTSDGVEERDDGFVAAGYRRELQRFMGGAVAMLDRIGRDETVRAGVEARINWNATSALYTRWIVVNQSGRPAAPFARLEFRPTSRAWVTLAYGWADRGDGPFPLEDPLPSAAERDVFTFTVRGDF
jgi:hypothetical protein